MKGFRRGSLLIVLGIITMAGRLHKASDQADLGFRTDMTDFVVVLLGIVAVIGGMVLCRDFAKPTVQDGTNAPCPGDPLPGEGHSRHSWDDAPAENQEEETTRVPRQKR